MAQKIIGRSREKKELLGLYDSGRAEFVAVYGRRRVGKTFLVRELFRDKMAFHHTGLSPAELDEGSLKEQQIRAFYSTLLEYGAQLPSCPTNWIEAFDALRNLLKAQKQHKRLVVFIDELPWMDTPRSGFVTALEHFWNGWGAGQERLMLVVCGSATSWISDKLINNHGGLYGRVTREIHLGPFSLSECEAYYQANGIRMDRYDQLQNYMVMGGIPYYLSMLERDLSLAQNIDRLFFDRQARLKPELERLFSSSFTNAADCMAVVRLLAKRREGFTRKEIAETTRLPYGGGLSNTLRVLEVSDFIATYIPYGQSGRDLRYRLTDAFTLFHLTFVNNRKNSNPNFWRDNLSSPQLTAWRGFSFESVCFAHVGQIKQALGIPGVHTEVSPWRSRQKTDGAQIDMVIDRADRIVNLCEMKFSQSDFAIDHSYDASLRKKTAVFEEETKCRKALHTTLITTYGLVRNEHAGRIQSLVTMDDLFAP